MAKLSPMMDQYFQIKEQHKDKILFFRLGDFYEMFYDDAKLISQELDLRLTGKGCGQEDKAPMCGVPFHSSEAYIARLISKGYKVAICEQVENPSQSKGLVKREVVRVVTPGTVIEDTMLDETSNNFICSIFEGNLNTGICFCDVSTGELYATYLFEKERINAIKDELSRYTPREVLIAGEVDHLKDLSIFIKGKLCCNVEMLEDDDSKRQGYKDILLKHFSKKNLDQLDLEQKDELIYSLGGLLFYLSKTQMKGLERINCIEFYKDSQFMKLDINTKRNLELTRTMRNGEKRGSLLWVIDKTKTAMGKRLIKNWIEQPLLNCSKINLRQYAVAELFKDNIKRSEIIEELSNIHDLERLATRVIYGSANSRDLLSLASAFSRLPNLKEILKGSDSDLLKEIYNNIDTLDDITNLINDSIYDKNSSNNKIDENDKGPKDIKDIMEDKIIKDGYSEEVDFLRNDINMGANFIVNIQKSERDKTGISKLKVAYNKVFGYYIEVSNSFKSKVPNTYIRKQTLANCERYITEELKSLEERILTARERIYQVENDIFNDILKQVSLNLFRIQETAKMVAQLDIIASFAEVSSINNYVCPIVNTSGKICIKDGRHPVVEKLLDGKSLFVPNDATLDKSSNRVSIITGPNMAGKSTYMRQIALIVLMAQIGCFIPAGFGEIGIVDSIFTRVGASDDLSSGQSTFMVEMSEVADIVKNATSNSLLILDEIGRGTSTFDGMSIARAVLEHVASKETLGAKTLFSTHYHELIELENIIDGVNNYNVVVKKHGDDITFLRRIVPGGADDSYGIEVAKLAGIPDSIVKRSKQILIDIENNNLKGKDLDNKNKVDSNYNSIEPKDSSCQDKLIKKLKSIDVNSLTPIEALTELFELVNMVN